MDYSIVFTHANCVDGLLAAWAAFMAAPESVRNILPKSGVFVSTKDPTFWPHSLESALILKGHSPIILVFVQPSTTIPLELVTGERVLILDVDFAEQLEGIILASKSTLLIDHHISTEKTLRLLQERGTVSGEKFQYIFEPSHTQSAATLAWAWFHKTPLPPLLELARVVDTGSWDEDPNATLKMKGLSISKKIDNFPSITATVNKWSRTLENKMVQKGQIFKKAKRVILEEIALKAQPGKIISDDREYHILYVQSTMASKALADQVMVTWKENFTKKGFRIDFVAIWFYIPPSEDEEVGTVIVSLRNPEANINLNDVARGVAMTYGSGGHEKAASFNFKGIENFHYFIQPLRGFERREVLKTPAPSHVPFSSPVPAPSHIPAPSHVPIPTRLEPLAPRIALPTPQVGTISAPLAPIKVMAPLPRPSVPGTIFLPIPGIVSLSGRDKSLRATTFSPASSEFIPRVPK